jgi:hypothetical protein
MSTDGTRSKLLLTSLGYYDLQIMSQSPNQMNLNFTLKWPFPPPHLHVLSKTIQNRFSSKKDKYFGSKMICWNPWMSTELKTKFHSFIEDLHVTSSMTLRTVTAILEVFYLRRTGRFNGNNVRKRQKIGHFSGPIEMFQCIKSNRNFDVKIWKVFIYLHLYFLAN